MSEPELLTKAEAWDGWLDHMEPEWEAFSNGYDAAWRWVERLAEDGRARLETERQLWPGAGLHDESCPCSTCALLRRVEEAER